MSCFHNHQVIRGRLIRKPGALRIGGIRYPKKFMIRVIEIFKHHGMLIVGMFLAAAGVKARHAMIMLGMSLSAHQTVK